MGLCSGRMQCGFPRRSFLCSLFFLSKRYWSADENFLFILKQRYFSLGWSGIRAVLMIHWIKDKLLTCDHWKKAYIFLDFHMGVFRWGTNCPNPNNCALFMKVWGLGWKSGGRGISLAANHYSYTWMQLLSSFLKWNRVCPWSSFIFLFMFILSSAGFYELPCNRYPNSIRVNSLNLFQCPENPTCRTQHLSVVKQFRATLCIC